MQLEKKKQFLLNTLFVLTLVFLFLLVFQYLSGVLFPILAGFLIAYSLRPLVVNITKRWNSNYQITAFFVVTAFYVILGLLLWLGFGYLFSQVVSFFSSLPQIYQTSIAPLVGASTNGWNRLRLFGGVFPLRFPCRKLTLAKPYKLCWAGCPLPL